MTKAPTAKTQADEEPTIRQLQAAARDMSEPPLRWNPPMHVGSTDRSVLVDEISTNAAELDLGDLLEPNTKAVLKALGVGPWQDEDPETWEPRPADEGQDQAQPQPQEGPTEAELAAIEEDATPVDDVPEDAPAVGKPAPAKGAPKTPKKAHAPAKAAKAPTAPQKPKKQAPLAQKQAIKQAPAAKKPAKGRGRGIGEWVKSQLRKDKKASNKQLAEEARRQFPGAKTSAACVAWYRTRL